MRKADAQVEEHEEGVARDGIGAALPHVRDGRTRMPLPTPFLPVPEQADAEQRAREERRLAAVEALSRREK
jgi:hypothetical protein